MASGVLLATSAIDGERRMIRRILADPGVVRHAGQGPLPQGLEFAPDWWRGVDVATRLWADDAARGQQGRDLGVDATAFLAPAMRWLISPGDEHPSGLGDRLVGEPDVDMVRRITAVYRGLDNQYGGGHVRASLVRSARVAIAVRLPWRA
jgi:hypothetical protein